MVTTCLPSWAKRDTTTARAPFYRFLPSAGNDARVLAYNGAPLLRQQGTAYGIPYTDVTGLAAKPVAIVEIEATGAVVLACEDGGIIDVAARS